MNTEPTTTPTLAEVRETLSNMESPILSLRQGIRCLLDVALSDSFGGDNRESLIFIQEGLYRQVEHISALYLRAWGGVS